ncbi:MAG TPA: hypothetical protein VJ553_02915 [Candidatus Paceibacterota bacterium]|nr:hypothetical protein [Candidatus Paceibacterota bacterium]
MRIPALGTVLLIALLAASVCGALMACMDSFSHHSILANADPVPVMVVMAFMLLTGAVMTIAVLPQSFRSPLSILDRNRGPDLPLWHPLQRAFSDGILQPKVF